MNRLDNQDLERLLQEAEFDRGHVEVKEIEERIRSFVHEIAKYIGRKDPLFRNFVIPSGSFYEDLKVEGPDEFDFMICLEGLSQPGVCEKKEIPMRPVPDPGYVDVKIKDRTARQRWKRYISQRGNLKPDVLLKRFQELIKKAVKKRKSFSYDKIAERIVVELRKIPVTIKLTWKGTKYRNYEICIDLTLCIKMFGWPEASDITKRVKRGHPGYEVFRKAIREGHHLVASTIGESGKQRPCWRLSFSVAEGIVLNTICKDPKLMHKAVVKVLKFLRKKNEDDLSLLEGVSRSYSINWPCQSYVFKTTFLQEWTEYPEDSHWTKDKLRRRVKAILERIKRSVKRRDIRSFWVPHYKLFNFRARNATQTARCEASLARLIYKLRREPNVHANENETDLSYPLGKLNLYG